MLKELFAAARSVAQLTKTASLKVARATATLIRLLASIVWDSLMHWARHHLVDVLVITIVIMLKATHPTAETSDRQPAQFELAITDNRQT